MDEKFDYELLKKQAEEAEPLIELQKTKIVKKAVSNIKKFLEKNGMLDSRIELTIYPKSFGKDSVETEGKLCTNKGIIYYYNN